jgi:hypothetical protein
MTVTDRHLMRNVDVLVNNGLAGCTNKNMHLSSMHVADRIKWQLRQSIYIARTYKRDNDKSVFGTMN